jgi:hypothetical protein
MHMDASNLERDRCRDTEWQGTVTRFPRSCEKKKKWFVGNTVSC